jgi:hypothetical protein
VVIRKHLLEAIKIRRTPTQYYCSPECALARGDMDLSPLLAARPQLEGKFAPAAKGAAIEK